MQIGDNVGKAASAAIRAIAPSPLAVALLFVNIGFLVFTAYVLGEIASNAKERNVSQMKMIEELIGECARK